jgi:capsular polysaccharide transport system permease protein
LSIIYVQFFFIYVYSSNVVFSIRNIEENQSPAISLFTDQIQSPSSKNIKKLEEYLKSQEIFELLNNKFNLKKIYNDKEKTNFYERFFIKYDEDYLKNYQNNLSFVVDEDLIKLSFNSYNTEFSKKVIEFLLKKGELFLNNLEENKIKKNLFFIKNDLNNKKIKLIRLQNKLNQFQNNYKIIDPNLEIKSEYTFQNQLKIEKIKKESQYNVKKTYMNEKSPELKELKQYIQELNKNIKNINKNIYGDDNKLIGKMIQFQELKQQLKFQLELYKNTLTNYELNLIQNNKNKEYVEIITKPTTSNKFIYPEKFKIIFITFIFSLLLNFIFQSIFKLIKEHKDN